MKEYKKVSNVLYVLIEGVDNNNNVKIYYDNKLVNYLIISNENSQIKINLKKQYLCDKLLFYIEETEEYTITLYADENFENELLSKKISNEKITIPDKTWITEKTKFSTYKTHGELEESVFNKFVKETSICSYKEKYVYKYNVTKEYYDDNYYFNLDGYIKDLNDYKIYYNQKPITNNVTITEEKKIEIPLIEYIYVENENDSSKNIELKQENPKETITVTKEITKDKIIEKEVFKIPKKIYIIISILLLFITILIVKLYRKSVE